MKFCIVFSPVIINLCCRSARGKRSWVAIAVGNFCRPRSIPDDKSKNRFTITGLNCDLNMLVYFTNMTHHRKPSDCPAILWNASGQFALSNPSRTGEDCVKYCCHLRPAFYKYGRRKWPQIGDLIQHGGEMCLFAVIFVRIFIVLATSSRWCFATIPC